MLSLHNQKMRLPLSVQSLEEFWSVVDTDGTGLTSSKEMLWKNGSISLAAPVWM